MAENTVKSCAGYVTTLRVFLEIYSRSGYIIYMYSWYMYMLNVEKACFGPYYCTRADRLYH